MKQHQGIWLPDHEQHMIEWMNKSGEIVDGRGTYQIKKWRACIPWIKNWSAAVDVGAHVGFWAMHIAKRFGWLEAFEPVKAHRECLAKNMEGIMNYEIHPYALGNVHGKVSLTIPPGSSGGTHIDGAGDIEMLTLDSYDFHQIGFIKIDCEGYELQVVQGAVETIKRCRPCIIAEQKPHTTGGRKHLATGGKPAVDFLISLGAILRQEIGGDFILSFD